MTKNSTILFCGVLIFLALYFSFLTYRGNENILFSKLSVQLKEEKFEDLYAESSDSIKRYTTKKQFVEKMKEAATKMRQIDGNLNFQRDYGWEKTTPVNRPNEQGYRFTVQRLENDNVSAFVIVYWNDSKFFPKFQNIIISQTDDLNSQWSDEYQFNGF